jgi:tight adherence protein C
MTICVESGLSLEDAFDRVAGEFKRISPEVSSEFKTTRSEMLVSDRFEALRRLERRSGVREMGVMAGSLAQSMSYGTPLSEALRSIAADCRAAQVSELEEKAGAISARIGVPLVLLILFPLVALIAAPAAINLIRAFSPY